MLPGNDNEAPENWEVEELDVDSMDGFTRAPWWQLPDLGLHCCPFKRGVMVLHAYAMMSWGLSKKERLKGFAMLAFHACVLKWFSGLPGGCVERKLN